MMRRLLFVLPLAAACSGAIEPEPILPGDAGAGGDLVATINGSPRGFGATDHSWQSAANAQAWDHMIEATSENGWRITLAIRSAATPGTIACGDARVSVRVVKIPASNTTPFYLADQHCAVTVTRSGTKAGDVVEGTFSAELTSPDKLRSADNLSIRDGAFRVTIGLDEPPPPTR